MPLYADSMDMPHGSQQSNWTLEHFEYGVNCAAAFGVAGYILTRAIHRSPGEHMHINSAYRSPQIAGIAIAKGLIAIGASACWAYAIRYGAYAYRMHTRITYN